MVATTGTTIAEEMGRAAYVLKQNNMGLLPEYIGSGDYLWLAIEPETGETVQLVTSSPFTGNDVGARLVRAMLGRIQGPKLALEN